MKPDAVDVHDQGAGAQAADVVFGVEQKPGRAAVGDDAPGRRLVFRDDLLDLLNHRNELSLGDFLVEDAPRLVREPAEIRQAGDFMAVFVAERDPLTGGRKGVATDRHQPFEPAAVRLNQHEAAEGVVFEPDTGKVKITGTRGSCGFGRWHVGGMIHVCSRVFCARVVAGNGRPFA
jgi:hypothetical protein